MTLDALVAGYALLVLIGGFLVALVPLVPPKRRRRVPLNRRIS